MHRSVVVVQFVIWSLSCGLPTPDFSAYDGGPEELGLGLELFFESANITEAKNRLLSKLHRGEGEIVQETLAVSLDHIIVLGASIPNWSKPCHMHNSDAQMRVLQGKFGFKLHTRSQPYFVTPGNEFYLPKYHPHAEIAGPDDYLVFLVRWIPVPDKATMTIPLTEEECESSIHPPVQIPKINKNLQEPYLNPPKIPSRYTATLVLLPFITTKTKFLKEFTLAKITETNNTMYAFLKGCESGESLSVKIDGDTSYEKVGDGMWEKSSTQWNMPSSFWKPALYVASTEKDIWTNNLGYMFWFEKGLPIMMTFKRQSIEKSKTFLRHYSVILFTDFTYNVVQEEGDFFESIDHDFSDVSCGNTASYKLPQLSSHYQASYIKTDLVTAHPVPGITTYYWDDSGADRYDKVQVDNYFTIGTQENTRREVMFGGEEYVGSWLLESRKDDWTTSCTRNTGKTQRSPKWLSQFYTSRVVATINHPIKGLVTIVTYEDRYELRSYWGWYKVSETEQPTPLMELLSEQWLLQYHQFDILIHEPDPHNYYLEESLKKFCKSDYTEEGNSEEVTPSPPVVDHSYEYDLPYRDDNDPVFDEIIKRLKEQLEKHNKIDN